MKRIHRFLAPLLLALAPAIASAHEVYVLTPDEVTKDIAMPAFSEFAVLTSQLGDFVFWAFIAALTVFVVFFVSISRTLEIKLDPWLAKLRPYAPVVSRVTLGVAFLAAAWFGAAFGPELPLDAAWGHYAFAVRVLLGILGVLFFFGIAIRYAAGIAVVLFAAYVFRYHVYMLTYANYLGEIVVLLILGAAGHGASRRQTAWSFFFLRFTFGISLLYASLYAKIIHNNLALDVASLPLAGHMTSIASVFGFEPHFMVLGAAIIEIVIAVFFILGIEIRFTALFLEFWLTLSLLYFGEVVWPHLILIGIPIAFMFYGYDKLSLEGHFFKEGRAPVL